jgi:hypothetical protein
MQLCGTQRLDLEHADSTRFLAPLMEPRLLAGFSKQHKETTYLKDLKDISLRWASFTWLAEVAQTGMIHGTRASTGPRTVWF